MPLRLNSLLMRPSSHLSRGLFALLSSRLSAHSAVALSNHNVTPPVPHFPLRSSAQTTVSLRQLEVNTQPLTCSGYLAPLVTRFSNFHVCSYACGLHFPLYRPLEVDEIGFTCVSADRRFPKIQEIGANLSVHLLFYMPASGLYRNTFCCNYLVITMKKSHISTTRD